jgi:hypothetical protein
MLILLVKLMLVLVQYSVFSLLVTSNGTFQFQFSPVDLQVLLDADTLVNPGYADVFRRMTRSCLGDASGMLRLF